MLNKRLISIVSFILLISLIFSACGGSSSDYAVASSAPAAAAPMAPMAPTMMKSASTSTEAVEEEFGYDAAAGIVSNSAQFSSASLPSNRKIVKHSSMELETKDFDTAFSQIIEMVNKSGGYIENQSISNQSLRYNDDYYERYADISARIPAQKLAEVTGAIGGICNVTSHWEGIDDITDTYFDTDARLNSLKLQEERLLEILAKAESLEDVITLEAKLSDVRYEIESLTARMRRMDNQVAYSYLNMNLREVVEYKPVTATPKSFSDRVSDAFVRSGAKLSGFFANTVIFLIEDFPLMLIQIVIWLVVLLIIARLVIWLLRIFGLKTSKIDKFSFKRPFKSKGNSINQEEVNK